MNGIEQLLANCANRGVSLRLAPSGKLIVGGPRGALTAELVEELRARKEILLAVFAAEETRKAITGKQEAVTQRARGSLIAREQDHDLETGSNVHALAQQEVPKVAKTRPNRLCGRGFSAIPITIPPPEILATPVVLCRKCGQRPVLKELRNMTGGRCYECWIGQGVGNA